MYDVKIDHGVTTILKMRFALKLAFFDNPDPYDDYQYIDIYSWQDLLNWMEFTEKYGVLINEFSNLRRKTQKDSCLKTNYLTPELLQDL